MHAQPVAEPTERLAPTRAVVHRVLPLFGLADLVGEDGRLWSVTRSTDGPGLDTLAPGMQLELDLCQVHDGASVLRYRPAQAALCCDA